MLLQDVYYLVLAPTHILLHRNFNKTTMKLKVLFGISAMLLTTQITMAQIKDVVKNDTTTLNKKESKEWYEKEHGAVSK